MASRRRFSVPPSAARLTESLRDIGYDPQAAVADLVDNSIAAGATRIEIVVDEDDGGPRIVIADDGCGMSANMVNEALRFGTRRTYGAADLGRYGLGLKRHPSHNAALLPLSRVVAARVPRPSVNLTSTSSQNSTNGSS